MSFENVPMIVSLNEPHMACLLLVDTSGSMSGEAINSLNEGLNKFKTDVCKNEQAKKVLDVAIVEFNSTVKVIQPWYSIQFMEPITLVENGETDMVGGLRVAIDMVRERSRFYINETGTVPYKPWIVMITDSYPSDSIDEIAELAQKGKLLLWSLAVEGTNTAILNRLCGDKRALKLKGNR